MEPAAEHGIRAWQPGDTATMLAVAVACLERSEFDGTTRHDIEESFKRLPADPSACAVAVEGGRVVGWVIPQHDDLTVDPAYRRRGHGTRLVQAGLDIARAHGLPALRLWASRHRPGPRTFLAGCGFHYGGSMWLMRLPAGAPVARPVFPADVVGRPLAPGVDDARFVELANDAFADHPSPMRFSIERVSLVHALPDFQPGSVLLVAPAAEPHRPVGLVRVQRYRDDDGREVGDISVLGLRPGWRGRGLGRQLLRWAVARLRDAGALDVFLSVEARNEGALRLYESEGFERHVEWPHWVRPV